MNEEPRIITTIETDAFFHHHTIDGARQRTRFSVHCHNGYEIYFFLRGSGHFVIEGHHHRLEPYTLILLRPGEFHCYQIESLQEYERYVIVFSEESINPAFRDILLEPFQSKTMDGGIIFYNLKESPLRQSFDRFVECKPHQKEIQSVLVSTLLQELLVTIKAISKKNERGETHKQTSRLILDILNYINGNISQTLSLETIVEKFYISKFHFSRKFHAQVGVTYQAYIANKRINIAQKLIEEGASASDACRLSGFGDYSTFYRAYKKIIGNCPRADMA